MAIKPVSNRYWVPAYLIAIGIISVVIYQVATSQYTLIWLGVITSGVIAVAPWIYEWRRGYPDSFAPILWVAPTLFFLYGATAGQWLLAGDISLVGEYASSRDPSYYMAVVVWLGALSIALLIVGYYRSPPRSLIEPLPSFKPGWHSRRAWVVISCFLLLGGIGYLSLPSASGPRAQLVEGDSRLGFVISNLLNAASILILADITQRIDYDNYQISIHGSIATIIIGGGIVLANSALMWTLGGRSRAFTIFVIGVFLFHYCIRRFSFVSAAALVVAIRGMPAWLADVAAEFVSLDPSGTITALTNPYLLRKSPTEPLNNLIVLFSGFPDQVRPQFGQTFLAAFFEVLPLAPFREAHEVFNYAYLPEAIDSYGVALTLMGELYLNFWIFGIIVGMYLVGILIRSLYEYLVTTNTVASLVLFSAFANQFMLTGNFSNAAPGMGLRLLPVIFGLIVITGRLDWDPQKWLLKIGQDV